MQKWCTIDFLLFSLITVSIFYSIKINSFNLLCNTKYPADNKVNSSKSKCKSSACYCIFFKTKLIT